MNLSYDNAIRALGSDNLSLYVIMCDLLIMLSDRTRYYCCSRSYCCLEPLP